ncbi:unnamed protein product [Chrysodeixis includens]|uniref:Uncharacterized protein n=1 Tax=Chrysodeixis includens TaxID=689277 RepID=A0A9P0BSW1_CHRIL|nr:unnamed protein product [Chrysodeixis includens]
MGPGFRSRDDDCPCRTRSSDSDGAASVFFPTALRPRGSIVRPDERKEDVKPLLHPEVDLASSVLQTIREATDEEYEDALARDAARSVAKAAIEDIYGDAAPEASRNLVTIIVKPKEAEVDDDIMMPHESRNHESRCIHSPLQSTRNLGKMRVVHNPPNLLHDIFGLPRRSKPGLLHRNLLDMDSGFGASNVEERVMRVDNDRVPLRDSSNLKTASNSDFENKDATLKPPSIHDKLKDLISGRSSFDDMIKTSLPPLPKLKPITPKFNINGANSHDLSPSPSNLEEELGKLSYVKANSHLENLLPKGRPLDLKNLLKLKDVELIPLKDLIKAKKQPKLELSSRTANEDNSSEIDESEVKDLLNLVPRVRTVELSDAEVSPTNVIQQVIDDNCDNISRNTNTEPEVAESEEKESSEFYNTTPSSQFVESAVNDRSTEIDSLQSAENVNNNNDCDLGTMPATVTDLPSPKERDLNNDMQEVERNDSGTETSEQPDSHELVGVQDKSVELSEDDCLVGKSDADTATGASNTVSNIVEPDPDKHDFIDKPVARQTQAVANGVDSLDNVKPKLIDPLGLDKHLNTIKKNIIEKIESLKFPRTNPGKSGLFSKESDEDENQNTDSNNEESVQITSVKPEDEVRNDSSEKTDGGSQVSMQDLQEMSDSMLQNEKERPRSNVECNVPTEKTAEPKEESTEVKSTDPEELSEEKILDSQNDDDMNTQSSINSDNVKNTCGSDLPQQTKARDDDNNVGASETVISKIPPRNSAKTFQLSDIVQPCSDSILQSPLPDLSDVLKMPPIPTLDDIKTKVSNLFDKGERNAENMLPLKAVPLIDPAKILEPIMATDASTRNSQSKPPPERFLDDLNILRLQPVSMLSQPKLSDDFGFKPINYQPSLNSQGLGSATGRSSSKNVNRKIGLDNPLDTMRRADIKARSKASPHNILKSSLKHDDFISGRALTDLSHNIDSHFKSASRNVHNMLESTLAGAKKAVPIQLEPHELLETISRNHEDVSDKLKAIHMDFNDRIETMRNDLLDKSRLLSREPPNRKPSIKPSGDQNRLRGSQSSVTPRKNTPSRRPEPKSNKGSSPSTRTKQFKMPTAASVPVPKTLNVPELKMMSKPPGLVPQRVTSPNVPKIELPQSNFDTFRNPERDTKPFIINKPYNKPVKPFGDTKVKVSFSTTPRPRIEVGKPRTQEKINLKTTPENRRVQSDVSQTKLSTGLLNKHKPVTKTAENDKRLSTPIRMPATKIDNLEHDRSLSDLLSWPKVSEGAFLSKVKEAFKARLPSSGLPNPLEQVKVQPSVKSTLGRTREDVTRGSDMSRAASEVVEKTDGQPMKENVTYKCKMVCTQE